MLRIECVSYVSKLGTGNSLISAFLEIVFIFSTPLSITGIHAIRGHKMVLMG